VFMPNLAKVTYRCIIETGGSSIWRTASADDAQLETNGYRDNLSTAAGPDGNPVAGTG
jgi:hypothetical protein